MARSRDHFKQLQGLDVSRPILLSSGLGGFFSYHTEKCKAAVLGWKC